MRRAKIADETDARKRLLAHYEAKIVDTAAKLERLERRVAEGAQPPARNMPGSATRLRTILEDTRRKAAELRSIIGS